VISEVLGPCEEGRTSSQFRRLGISPADCCRKPQDFDDVLVDRFQPMGALLIETRILTRFYRSIGSRYSRGDDINFAEEVKKARREFAKARAR
jgi:hypothetical protein